MVRYRRNSYTADSGSALTLAVGLTAVLALVGLTTVTTTTIETHMNEPMKTRTHANYAQIARYYTMSTQAFYAAEAGVEEARARLWIYAGLARIIDRAPYDPQWRVYIGSARQAQEYGYDPQQHARVDSLQTDLAYTVLVRHATHATDHHVLRWGDAHSVGVNTPNTTKGESIYVITAHGMMGSARRTIEIEATPEPPPTIPAALYVKGLTRIGGQRTSISGIDRCGKHNQPGVRTMLPPSLTVSTDETTHTISAIEQYEGPVITGLPPLAYHSAPLNVQAMIDTLQRACHYCLCVRSR